MNWFYGDPHLGHHNILKLCNRNFSSITEHDKEFIRKFNSVVNDSDISYCLGDFAYKCEPSYAVECLSQLKGRHYLLWGNHDKPLRTAYQNYLLNDLIKDKKLQIIGSPDPRIETSITIDIDGQTIILSHCAKRTWYYAFRGSWHLFAHSHSNLGMLYKSMDIGVDNNNFYPFSFTQIKEIMAKVTEDFKE